MVKADDNQVAPTALPWNYEQLNQGRTMLNLQTGTNAFESQKGMTAIGAVRQNVYTTKDKGRLEPDRSGEHILKPIYGTNKFASQAGQTPIGALRSQVQRVVNKEEWDYYGTDKNSESVLPMQSGSNKFASQSGLVGGLGSRRNQCYRSPAMKTKDRRSEGIVPYQAGTNCFASQARMTDKPGCGAYRQVTTEIDGLNISESELRASSKYTPWAAGTNKFETQAGTGGFAKGRDVKTTPTDRNPLPPIEKMKSESIIPLQNGTNKLASQRGMTGFGMPRDMLYKPKFKQSWIDEYEAAEKEWIESGRGKMIDKKKWDRQQRTVDRLHSTEQKIPEEDDDEANDDSADVSYSVSLREGDV